MRTDKARLPLPGGTLVERVLAQVDDLFDEVLISVSRAQAGTFPGRRTIVDGTAGLGPIEGLRAGLKAARNETCAVLACDIPEVDSKLLRSLLRRAESHEIAVPVTPEGLLEPLFGVYTKGLVPLIEGSIRAGEYSLLPLIEAARTVKVKMGRRNRLRNLNTPDDYEAYVESLRARPATRPPYGKGHRREPAPAPRKPARRRAP